MWQSSAVSLAEYKTIVGTLGNGCTKSLCFAGGQCILLVLADMRCTFFVKCAIYRIACFRVRSRNNYREEGGRESAEEFVAAIPEEAAQH